MVYLVQSHTLIRERYGGDKVRLVRSQVLQRHHAVLAPNEFNDVFGYGPSVVPRGAMLYELLEGIRQVWETHHFAR